MTLTLDRINKAREAGYDDDKIIDSIQRRDPEFGKRIAKAREAGYDSKKIMQSIENRLNTPVNTPVEQQETPKQRELIQSLKSGLGESASGQLGQAVFNNKGAEMPQDPDFWEKLAHSGGTVFGDLPYMLAGGTLGAAIGGTAGSVVPGIGTGIGGTVGGAFGALALPTFLKEALKEYNEHTAKGNDLTFGEFLQQADRVASKTLKEGAFGVILGSVTKAMPMLQKLPGIGSLFTSKPAQKAATIAGETVAAAVIPSAVEGRLPTGDDFAQSLAVVLGFNAAKLPAALKRRISDSGKTPERYLKDMPRDEIIELAKVLQENPQAESKDLSNRKAEIIQSTETAKASNLTNRIEIEPAREKVTERRPENVNKETAKIEADRAQTSSLIQDLPKGNKKNLAKEMYKRGNVATPEQLNLFLDEYEATYQSLPGRTGLDKNRKFLNRYAESNKQQRDIKQISGKPVIDVKPTSERRLEIGRTQKREAKLENNKAKLKEAKKRIDLSKRGIENQKREATKTPEATKENVKPKDKENVQTKQQRTGLTFQTAKGSVYEVNSDGSTTRNKKYRPEHGPKEQGPQPQSESTRYITEADANKLGEFQSQGSGSKRIFQYPDGRIAVQYISGPHQGKVEARTIVSSKSEPEVGLIPLETWENGKTAHFGNKIVLVGNAPVEKKPWPYQIKEIRGKDSAKVVVVPKGTPLQVTNKSPLKMSVKKPYKKKNKVAKPIVETTGQSASDRMERLPSTTEKITKKAGDVVEAISKPQELADKIYTKAFDALEPLNKLEVGMPTEDKVTTRIKQSQSAASDVNQVLTQGIFDNVSNTFDSGSLKDVYTGEGNLWKKVTRGLKPGEYSVEEMDVYRLSKEALKRQQKGLKSGIDTSKAQADVARLKQKYGPVDQRLRDFQKRTLEHYGKDIFTPETREMWTKESHASLYRVMDYGKDAILKEGSLQPTKWWHKAVGSGRKILPPSESDIQNISMLVTNSKKNDSIVQYKKLVEQGRLPGKIVKSKNKEMPSKMMEDLEINPENSQLAEQIYNQSRKDAFTPENGRIRGWENGKPFEIEVPQDVYETFSSLAPSDTGMFTQLFKSTNNLMSRGIVLEPRKFISIVGRDALSSLIYSKTGSNPLSIVRALTDIYKDTKSWNQFKSLGGEQYVSRLMTRSDRSAKISELIKSERPNAKIVPFNKLGTFLKEFNGKLAAAVPFAEYQRSVAKYGDTPSGRLQALINAKEVSYDPTKKGSSKLVKGAANFFPFFNVMLQEPAMIAKNMKRPQFWAKGAIGLTLPGLLLHFYNEGNPDYDDMNPILKYSCFHLFTEDSHYACPIPWLLGALFVSTPLAFYDMLAHNDPDGFKGLKSYVLSQLSGSFGPVVQAAVEQSTGETLPSPLGLVMMPFTDVEKRAPPVVPKRLQNLPPEQQYTSKTSQVARWYGDLWKVSPVKVERLIKTFTGGLGADALALIDEMAYQTGLAEDDRPEQGWKNRLLLGNFIYDSTPSNTKYTEKFYSMLEQERINKLRDLPNSYQTLNRYNQDISKMFKRYRSVEESKIDSSTKKEQLTKIQKEINAAYKRAVQSINKE